jgi:exopolyphosphatase/guanosine-5'-triphosphate,3'-diphosphate pyrophosphatase
VWANTAAAPQTTTDEPIFAALDLGTHNCRLLAAMPAPGGFRVVDAFSRIVRLGEGLGRTGALAEGAMRRAIEALKVCVERMTRIGVSKSRSVATEACRRAANCDQFIERVHAETGLDLEIISSAEEARLALDGCAPLLEGEHEHAVVFDIGGGSTELMWLSVGAGREPRIEESMSLPYGVVTLAERYGGGRLPFPIYREIVGKVARRVAPFESRHRIRERIPGGTVQMLGTSGTVTTLAGVHLGLSRYNRSLVDGAYLTFTDVAAMSRKLAAMTAGERARHPCIGPKRADLVVAGCAILEAICETFPVGSLRVADRGVREGILLGLIRAASAEPPAVQGAAMGSVSGPAPESAAASVPGSARG